MKKELKALINVIWWMILFIAGMYCGVYGTPKAHAASWDTAGNVVGANDYIGSTNGQPLNFKIGIDTVYRIQSDGMRFMKPITTITNSNGVTILSHYTSNGCTGIFGNINKILNICSDGFTFTGGPVNFKTKYVIYPDGGTYMLTPTDYTVEFTNGGDGVVPSATMANQGKHYEIINPSTGALPIHTDSGQMIGIESEYQVPPNGAVTIVSNGSMWRVIK